MGFIIAAVLAGWGITALKSPDTAKAMSLYALGAIFMALMDHKVYHREIISEAHKVRHARREEVTKLSFSHANHPI